MFQNPYMYNINGNEDGQFLSSYPPGNLLGGNNVNPSRPRPIYNVNPQHNLPTYGLDINENPYENNNNNKNTVPYKNKKANQVIKDIINFNEDKPNNIIIIIT